MSNRNGFVGKFRLFAFSTLFAVSLFPIQLAFATEIDRARTEIQRIKERQDLSGNERAVAAQTYIRNLPDKNLQKLISQLGPGQFLHRLPDRKARREAATQGRSEHRANPPEGRSRNDRKIVGRGNEFSEALRPDDKKNDDRLGASRNPDRVSEVDKTTLPGQKPSEGRAEQVNPRQEQQQRLQQALRYPQERERLTQAVTNYLLNTTPIDKR